MGISLTAARRHGALIAALATITMLAPAPALAAVSTPPPSEPSASPAPPAPEEPDPSVEPAPTVEPEPTAEPLPSDDPESSPEDATTEDSPASVGTTAVATTANRIDGADRYSVAVTVSQTAFPAGAPVVFLAQGDDFPDALSAGPAAVSEGAPILLTPSDWLPASVSAELKRLAPQRVVVLGGTVSVAPAVVSAVERLGFPVQRVDGPDRFAVSRSVARSFLPDATTAFISSGEKFPDALAAGSAAGRLGAPMILVQGSSNEIDPETLALLDELGVATVHILGGTATISQGIEDALRARGGSVERIGGANRFGVAVAVAQRFFPSAPRAYLTSGMNFPDALAGSALAGAQGAPLYSVPSDCPTTETLDDALGRLGVPTVTILGGRASVSRDADLLRGCWPAKQARWDSQVALVSKLESAMAGLPGQYQVSVRELGGMERAADVRGDVLVEPASVIKLFAAYVILDRIDRGQLSWSTPTRSGVRVSECLRVMIHISDNSCHADLLALVGNDAINRTLWAAGFTETFYVGYDGAGRYQSAKKSSTSDLVELLSRLEQGRLLSAPSTAYLQGQLTDQLWRSKIPSGIPSGVAFGNKTGSLWLTDGLMEGDAGIVRAPSGTYAVSIIGIKNARNWAVARLSEVIYEHLSATAISPASWGTTNLVTVAPSALYADAGRTFVGWVDTGTRLDADISNRVWYRVLQQGQVRWVHHGDVVTRY